MLDLLGHVYFEGALHYVIKMPCSKSPIQVGVQVQKTGPSTVVQHFFPSGRVQRCVYVCRTFDVHEATKCSLWYS